MATIMLSGGFDPLHPGHIRMFKAAAKHGDVVVALNSDDWLKRKKGFAFQNWDQRAEILSALSAVRDVTGVDDGDGTVCEALRRRKPEFFGNGGDRGPGNTPELAVCAELGIMPVFDLGGGKLASSSDLLAQAKDLARVNRSWGHYTVLAAGVGYKVKLLTFTGGRTRDQRHERRSEEWLCLEGQIETQSGPLGPEPFDSLTVLAREWHWLGGIGRVLEIQRGDYCGEDDIEVRSVA